AELALRESEARFRAIFEKSHDSLVLFREDRCIDCNRQALELYGYPSREEFLGIRPADLSPEFQPDGQDSGSSAAAHTRTVFENGSDHFEWLHQRKDGTTFLADVLLSAFELDRKPVFLSSVRDITERKRMEEELTLLKISVDNAYDEVFWLDFSGNILYVNDSACRITGYSWEELSAMKVFELDPDFSPETWEKAVAGLREQKTNFRITRHRKKDGGIIDVEIATVYVKRDGREYSFAFVRDITGRRLAEQNVQTTLAFLNALIDQNPDPVWISDEKGVLIRLNAACCRLLHCTEEDVVGKYNVLKDNIVEEQGFMPLVKSVFEQGRAVSFPLTYDSSRLDAPVLKQTVSLTLEVTIFPIKDAAGTVTNAVIIHNDITERKRIEDALRINEEKFRALVETTSDFIWEVDTEGRYTYVSPQVREMLGYEPGELEGRTPFDLMPPDEARRVFAEFDRCVRSRSPITSLENAVLRKDGSVVVLETSGVARTGKDGSYQGYRGIDRDISRRKRAEQALKESEARLQSIMEGSPILQFVIDRNHRVIFWNRAIEEYSGIPAAAIIGTSNQWRAFYPEKRPILVDLLLDGSPEDLSRWYGGNLRKSRYVEGACEATGFFSHMGTSGIWLAFTAAPIRDASGTVIGAIETLEDVTERMNAEKALQESEEWSRTILTTAQAGIILVDAATHLIIDANPKALEMIGLPRESVAGRVCHRFICPAEEGKCPVSNLGLNMDTSERVLLTATGSRIPVLKTVKPVTVGGRNILVESFVDISEQKRTEAAIQEANRKLNLLNSITRHDVANQLTILQGYAQIAAMKKPDPVVADFLEKIQAAAGTISRQIEFTRMYQEMGVRAPVWTRIDGTITRAYSIPIRFSDRCKTIEIYADPMIEQVFSNLVDNTIRHGSGATEIAVRCEPAPEGIVIFVEDNGLGIATAEKERIFEKGYGKNTGFGLFLVREILAITGITIRETGIPGKGARFEISVPQSAFRVV
ncbi:MAG TPA: PAS domain S-box protein, partial [Methanoregula sp.]|nr:PAS domain S-box protein [Methanoregula sp.]